MAVAGNFVCLFVDQRRQRVFGVVQDGSGDVDEAVLVQPEGIGSPEVHNVGTVERLGGLVRLWPRDCRRQCLGGPA